MQIGCQDDIVHQLFKRAFTNTIKRVNEMGIKEELHKLVDNLDVDRLIPPLFESICKSLQDFQKEPTLEEKLLKMGFVMKSKNVVHAVYWKKLMSVTIYNAERSVVVSHENSYFNDNLLNSKKNHDQIFADIAYLENKYK